jgi:hypothetical protein
MRFTSEVSFDLKGDKQRAASYIPFVRTLIKVVENVFTTKGLGASETFTFRREIAPGVEVSIFYGAPYPSVTITAAPGGGEKQESIEYLVRPLWEPEGFLVSYPGVDVSLFVDTYGSLHCHAKYLFYNTYYPMYAPPGIVPFPPCAIINRYRNNKYGDKLVKDDKILPLLDKPYLVSWLPLIHAEYTEEDKTDGPGIYKLVKSVTPEGTTVSKFVRLPPNKHPLPKEKETNTWFLHEPEIYTPPVHSFQVLLDLINELRQQVGGNDPDKARLLSFPFRGHGDLAYVICDEVVRSGLFSHNPEYRDPYKTVNGRSFIDITVFPTYISSYVLRENLALVPGSAKSDNTARIVFEGWKLSPEHFSVMTEGDYAASDFNYNLGQGPRYNPAAHIFGRSDASSVTMGPGIHGISGGGGLYDVPEGEKDSGHVWALDIRAQHSFAVAGDLITWEDAEGSERITMRSYAPTVFFDLQAVWKHIIESPTPAPNGDPVWMGWLGSVDGKLHLIYSSFFYKGRAIRGPGYSIFGDTPFVLLGVGKKKTGKNPGFYAVVAVYGRDRDDENNFPLDSFFSGFFPSGSRDRPYTKYKIHYCILYLPEHADPSTDWRRLHTFSNPVDDFIKGVSHVYFNASCTKFVFGTLSFNSSFTSESTNCWFECEFTHDNYSITVLSEDVPSRWGVLYASDLGLDIWADNYFYDMLYGDGASSGSDAASPHSSYTNTYIVRYGYIGDNLVHSSIHVDWSWTSELVSASSLDPEEEEAEDEYPPLEYADPNESDDEVYVVSHTHSFSCVLYPAVGPPLTLADASFRYCPALYIELAFGAYASKIQYEASGFFSDIYYTNYLYGPTFICRRSVAGVNDETRHIFAFRVDWNVEFLYFDGTGGLESVWSTFIGRDDIRSQFYLPYRVKFPYIYTYPISAFITLYSPYTQVCLKYKNEHFSALWIKPDGLYGGSNPPSPIVRSSLPSSLIAGRFPIGVI